MYTNYCRSTTTHLLSIQRSRSYVYVCMVVTLYNLKLPLKLRHDESIRWVHHRATTLIKNAKFLCGLPDAWVRPAMSSSWYSPTSLVLQGKEKKFAHNALFAISAAVYHGNSQKLLRRTAEFQEYLSKTAIMLVAAGVGSVLSRLKVLTIVSRLSLYFSLSHGMAIFRTSRWSRDILKKQNMKNSMA